VGGAFLTLQKAVDVVFGTLDLGGFDVTIQLGDGTYSGGVDQQSPQVGAGMVTIQGNAAHPENVIVTHATPGRLATIIATNGARLRVKDCEVRADVTSSNLFVRAGGYILYSSLRIGPSPGRHQVVADDQGYIICEGNYAIVGGGNGHWYAGGCGGLRCQGKTITIVGAPNFSVGFAQAEIIGAVIANGCSFVNKASATGKRYDVSAGAVLYTGNAGETYFPGAVAGVVASGGQYV
jgi:hypothetical protein